MLQAYVEYKEEKAKELHADKAQNDTDDDALEIVEVLANGSMVV